MTYNWSSVVDLIPGMRNHLRAVGYLKDRGVLSLSRPGTPRPMGGGDDHNIDCEYSILFREYFCVAADELAGTLDVPLSKLGVLYNGILTTGSLPSESRRQRAKRLDLERGKNYPALFGKGQLLFIVRTADKIESARLTADGYRFANPAHVSEIIGRTMKVPHRDVIDMIERLRVYSKPRQPLLSTGSYLACFAIRATLKGPQRSWDILVPTNQQCDLPMVQLSSGPLKSFQTKQLAALDRLSVSECIAYLNNVMSEMNLPAEKEFVEHVLDQISELTRLVPEEFFKQAVFSCQPVVAPELGHHRDQSPPQLYAFSIIPDVHGASIKSTVVTYIPLTFFKCLQRVYKQSPDHAILAQRIHREFGAILSHKDVQAQAVRQSRTRKSAHHRLSRLSIPSVSMSNSPRDYSNPFGDQRDNASEQDNATIRSESQSVNEGKRKSLAFGGIMVSSDTKVEIFDSEMDGNVEMSDLGVHSSVSVANEAPIYVDELFQMTSSRWRQR